MGIFSKALSRAPSGARSERRRFPRFEISEPTEVFGGDGCGGPWRGLIRDISSGGACIAVERELAVGGQVRFACSAGSLTAVVRHCSPSAQGYLIGVEFGTPVTLDAEMERTLPALW